MEIFQSISKSISDSIIKFQNKEIQQNTLNSKLLLNIAFNYFYFKKAFRKTKPLKEAQNKIFQLHFKKETATEASERIVYNKVKSNQETIENYLKIKDDNAKNLLNELLQKKDITKFVEHSYDCYIPPKNCSISMNNLLQAPNIRLNYRENYNQEINYHNPDVFLQIEEKSYKINIDHFEQPYLTQEDNKTIVENDIKQLVNLDDNKIFYSEKSMHDDVQWLKEIDENEIESNFNDLLEIKKDKKYDPDDDEDENGENNNKECFLFESYISNNNYNVSDIFNKIFQGDKKVKKIEGQLSDKCLKYFLKKMNYEYLDLMMVYYRGLCNELEKYDFIEPKEIAPTYIKKLILQFGLTNSKTYDNIIKAIKMKNNNFNFENFLDCFSPIFNISDKHSAFKYKFFLFICKNDSDEITMDNYRIFCKIIKGKSIYDERYYKKLTKSMITSLKSKYPKENSESFKYVHLSSIIEYLINNEYKDM